MLKVFIKRCSSCFRLNLGNRWKWLSIRGIVCCLAVVTQAQSATEYQVKPAVLFNFAKFVEWPADAFSGTDAPLQIRLLGQDPFGHEFEDVIGDKSVNGRRIDVIHPSGVPQARGCQIIFVASSEKNKALEILRGLRGASVLTVGDAPGFAGTIARSQLQRLGFLLSLVVLGENIHSAHYGTQGCGCHSQECGCPAGPLDPSLRLT